MKPAQQFFKQQGWQPFPFQQAVWKAVAEGQSGLLHATTGAGKTYAVWLAALNRFASGERSKRSLAGPLSQQGWERGAQVQSAALCSPLPPMVGEGLGERAAINERQANERASSKRRRKPIAPPLTVLWITPMRALAADTERALQAPLTALDLPWTVGVRSGDTTSSQRAKQARQLPTVLITTPESLSLLLSRADAAALFAQVGMVVVDEWHELIANKRGVQLQLALVRLRQWQPALITWGLSATLGNLPHALEVLVPQGGGQLVQGKLSKTLLIDTLLPKGIERFPWAGHLGLRLLPQVVDELAHSATALVFTNTRSQSELWYRALIEARPDWAGLIALHHGSLDRAVRDWVERALKDGSLKAVVCTSSLDLGVDFLPVERVLQIGSPKGVARLLQRAGRSGHAPGRASRLTLVPTNSLEIIEAVAAQDAIAAKQIEPRQSPEQPFDVLVQHLVTIALGGGFHADALYQEVRSSYAYRNLSEADWHWALAFVRHGGSSLAAYPDYRRAVPDDSGLWQVPDAQLARRHRLSIGTIVSDASLVLKFASRGGKALGMVEESFIARLKPGDHLLFAGRTLELVRVHEMVAYVRPAKGKQPAVPRWAGGRMPLSSELASAVVARLDAAAHGVFEGPEMQAVKPLLDVQQRWSALPTTRILLAETLKSREGWHLFLYPYAGRNVHQGLASLLGWRLGQQQPRSFSIAVNDYGFELLSPVEIDWPQAVSAALFSTENLLADVFASLNAGELAQRRFREIARIAGLVFQGMPGAPKSTRQVQASSKLFFDVFRQYDPENPLLSQSQQEVLGQELEVERLRATLTAMQAKPLQWQALQRPSPLAFPLLVERLRESASTEKLADRIARMVADLEKAAGGEAYAPPDAASDRSRFEGFAPPAPPARRERRTRRKPRR